jgi:23S rRNA (adenine-C8)-methyltransferase
MVKDAKLKRNKVIKETLEKIGAPDYRLKQVYNAIYKEPEFNRYSEIFTLPEEIREELVDKLGDTILSLTEKVSQEHKGTEKVLFETYDGHPIEAVKMHYENGRDTYCVSVQSGCAMNCAFCATGKMGFNRNLAVDEIIDQVLYFRKKGYSIDNVVFMGMGESFANPATFEALDILTNQQMMEVGKRRVSISTVGIIPGIKRMTNEYPQINLAFSLHTPFQQQREKIMPISKAYPIHEVMNTLAEHIRETNRKVLIAYILLGGVTDSTDHARALVELINRYEDEAYLFHVNLINFHEVPGKVDFRRTSEDKLQKFRNILYDAGIRTTVRQDFGESIDAACGQLGVD